MPSTAFLGALPFVLRWEGGFVNHPNDPGGATNKGVTQRVYDSWRARQGRPKQGVQHITDAEVQAIYDEGYWQPTRCDLLGNPLDLVQFDTAANMGVKRAIRLLQSAVGCSVDGAFGPETERAVAQCHRDESRRSQALVRYCDAREAYYRRLAAAKPTLAVFLRGWLNRLNALRREAGLPVAVAPGTRAPGEPAPMMRIPDIGEDPSFDF